MAKQDRMAALIIAAAAVVFIGLGFLFPAAGSAKDTTTYDLYRAQGEYFVNLGDSVTFEAQVIPYFEATAIGDAGVDDPMAPPEDEEADAKAKDEEAEAETDKSAAAAEEIDLEQFKFQWYYCQRLEGTKEIVYVPIEGANELTYTIDRVTEANLYDTNKLEYLLAMFPADATDLSYGNRLNISSMWFCCELKPDYVAANAPQQASLDPAGDASTGNYVTFATDEAGTFAVPPYNASGSMNDVVLSVTTLHGSAPVDSAEYKASEPIRIECDPANSYLLYWKTEGSTPVSFTYEVRGNTGSAYQFNSSELTPSDAGLNVYVDKVVIRNDGEYQLTVENPWVNADYTSSNERVCTVSDDGKIWAVGSGEAVVTVRQGNETADVAVTVK